MSPARWLPFSRSVTASRCRQRFNLAPYVLIPMPRKPLPDPLLLVSWLAIGSLQPEKTCTLPRRPSLFSISTLAARSYTPEISDHLL